MADTASAESALRTTGCADFFIAGAPRSGTTSLSTYLREHPEIHFSTPKETHYFIVSALESGDIQQRYVERFFPGYDPAIHRSVGEGSVSYLYYPSAIDQILARNPKARFVVMARNPMQLVPSFHARMLWVLQEDVPDFETAWGLEELRKRGQRIPARCLLPRLLEYSEIGKLGKYSQLLLDRVPRSQCLFILYDDFVADTAAVYRSVLDFLGVEPDGRTEFDTKAESHGYRHRWLQQLLFKPPGPVLGVVGNAAVRQRPIFQKLKFWRGVLVDYNRAENPRTRISPEMRAVMREIFQPDSELLGEILGRDLSHWYE